MCASTEAAAIGGRPAALAGSWRRVAVRRTVRPRNGDRQDAGAVKRGAGCRSRRRRATEVLGAYPMAACRCMWPKWISITGLPAKSPEPAVMSIRMCAADPMSSE